MPNLDTVFRRSGRSRPRFRGSAGARSLLGQSDFTYIGYWDIVSLASNQGIFANGLTHRYVSGSLRLLTTDYVGGGVYLRPQEITLTGDPSTGGAHTNGTHWDTASQVWGGTDQDGRGGHNHIWWEDPSDTNSDFWWSTVGDYPETPYTASNVQVLSLRKLASDGTASGFRGFFGLEGIGTRAMYGAIRKVPTWFRTANFSNGTYIHLGGGYSSLMAQGLGPALGPFFVVFPDPRGYTDSSTYYSQTPNIPATDFKIGADCRSGATAGNDWTAWGSYATRTFDRGVRSVFDVNNYYDNPSGDYTEAGGAIAPPAKWTGPATGDPDGYERWIWGDSYFGTGEWIDNDAGTRSKHGIVMMATLSRREGWYQDSQLNCHGKGAEFHVYDPADVALVMAGTLSPWKIRPVRIFEATDIFDMDFTNRQDVSRNGAIDGTTFDATTNTFYAKHRVQNQGDPRNISRIHAWTVAA